MTKIINNISEIIDKYEVIILDQWGVMHDGFKGYDHAISAVNNLVDNNKKLIIISNSSKRKNSSVKNLNLLGFNKNHFFETITSGEMIWQELFYSLENYGNKLNNCFHIYDSSKEDGSDFRAGLDKLNFVSKINEANFILACTPFANTEPLDYIPILTDALNLKLIMFCANPDYETIEKDHNKKNIFCMGTIADLYQSMGGRVIILGKPAKEIYIEATKKIVSLDLSKVIAIGDSLDHDIMGAHNFGIDSILIANGIHKEFFTNSLETGLNNIKNSAKHYIEPTYICSNFSY
ncbi:MAG: TIGR01459 family HAD-type hydrolase [Pelagibacteraceae bacterium]|nr:TIGR01459 family HAD-type hydrolase [Pelagibacteraceae bacterium]|tara:strand:- start:25929 stop:26804 length:876 start_codon:yes stop_codon:yes gene_type:complete